MKKGLKNIFIIIMIFSFLLLYILGVNNYIKNKTAFQIVNNIKDISKSKDIDCILILGAGIWGEEPGLLLKDRLEKGIELYRLGITNKIIMSGDHGRKEYDEVNVMKDYALKKGIPSEDIFMDHAGFSTYDSIYRAKEIFKVKKMIIVTQKYHLYRALYISNKLGVKAYGVFAKPIKYSGEVSRKQREILARNKDFLKCMYKPKPKYLGEIIPVNGDGNITNDKTKSF